MDGKSGKPPDFALLIGKRLDKKKGGEDSPPGMPGEPSDPNIGDGGEEAQMKDSAMSDFLGACKAGDTASAGAALEDFIKIVTGGGEPGEPDGEGPPPEEAA